MNRSQLEHVIRAAATIAGDSEIVVIGSQAILGRYPEAPAELLVSADADVYPRNHPERADLVEGSIGELLCLEPHDLVISKYVAGREKDRDYVRVALRHRLVEPATLLERLAVTPVDAPTRGRIARQVAADSAA